MTTTLVELRTKSRERSDMENSQFVSDSELNGYINASIAELHDILMQDYGSDYFITSFDFDTTQNAASYDLPSDFYKVHGVDVKLAGNEFLSIKKFNFNERNRYSDITIWNLTGIPSIRYRLVGNQIMFAPAPTGVYTVRLWYTPVATVLVNDSDTLDDLNQYSEYVIVDAAIKMLQKEESDVTVLMAQKQQLLQRITSAAQNRDAGEPESVSDVYSENDEYYFRS